MSTSETDTEVTLSHEDKRGKFTAVPLTYSFNGVEETWAGRGRHPISLSYIILDDKKMPKRVDSGWTWVDADEATLKAAQSAIDSMAKRAEKRAKALADKAAKPKRQRKSKDVPAEVAPTEVASEVTP